MTVQPELVEEIVAKIVAECVCENGRPLFLRNGRTTHVAPKGADSTIRIVRQWKKARDAGCSAAVLAELRRRGHDTGASIAEAAE